MQLLVLLGSLIWLRSVQLAVLIGVIVAMMGLTPRVSAQTSEAERPPVTFEDVLANPADAQLNFRFARQQVAAGDLTGAAVTLERILITYPNLQDIRLFYAIVLYRLDNYLEAEAELRRINVELLPDELKSEVGKYLDLIERRRQKTRYYAIAGVGVQYDSNATAAPSSERVSVFDVQFPVSGAEDDFGLFARASFGFSHDLGLQIESDVVGDLTFYGREQVEVESQDLRLVFGNLGTVHHFVWGDLEPGVTFGWLELSNQTFYHTIGPRVGVKRRINQDVTLRGEASVTYESFHGIRESQTASDRTGGRYDFGAGFDYTLTPTNLLRVKAIVTRKDAREDFEEYYGARIEATLTTLLFGDHFLQTGAILGFRDYDDPDPFFSSRTRRDEFGLLRLAYGVPLSSIIRRATGSPPDKLFEDVLVVPSIELYRQNSNITNFDYDNARVMLSLTKRFDF